MCCKVNVCLHTTRCRMGHKLGACSACALIICGCVSASSEVCPCSTVRGFYAAARASHRWDRAAFLPRIMRVILRECQEAMWSALTWYRLLRRGASCRAEIIRAVPNE